jgi:D-inositol-3-phosphate glycosyltransferase
LARGSLRILFLTHYSHPHVGGIEAVVGALSSRLRARGHDVLQIAAAVGEGAMGDENGQAVVRIPAWNGLERRLGVPYPVFGPRLVGEIRRRVEWADVVHAHGFLYMPSIVGFHYARRLERASGGPVRVLTEHVGHVDYSNPFLDRAESAAIASLGRYTVRAADVVLACNERVAEEVARLGARGPIEVVPNGIDVERFRPPTLEEKAAIRRDLGWDDRPRVLFVGRLVEKKGVDLATAAAEASGGAFELVVVGPGQLPVPPPSVRVLGALSPAEMVGLYRASDAFLLPSHGEGLPIAVLEALASGLPVFLRDDPTYAPLEDEAEGALTLLAPDPERIGAAIKDLLDDRDRHAAAAERAAEYARSRFSLERVTERHEGLYRHLVSESDP